MAGAVTCSITSVRLIALPLSHPFNAGLGSIQCCHHVHVACLARCLSVADIAQTLPSRKKSKKQKKKQRQQQAQMAAAGLDASSDSEPEAGAAPSHLGNAAASADGATDQHSQAAPDSKDDVLERMMQATNINQAAASHQVSSCMQISHVSVSLCQHVL